MAVAAERDYGGEWGPIPGQESVLSELEIRRYLTEVDHLLQHRQASYTYPKPVVEGVKTNLFTAVQEGAMPYAVTETYQHAQVQTDPESLKEKRRFMWLGKCAIDVAESGRAYHFSEAALARVETEIAEAAFSQEYLRPGFAQVFISPRMSPQDAPRHIAEAEHLYDDDAIRVSTCVTDEHGTVVGRRMQSLLVRDIPLEAWMYMLRDPNNIFGKSFTITDSFSARSVMELFDQMELPESSLPQGPVSILEAVLPYVFDVEQYDALKEQIEKYTKSQEVYHKEAMQAADKWLAFEQELAESLATGEATDEIRKFIMTQALTMDSDAIQLINDHHIGNTHYSMTRELAAVLEKRKQNVQKVRAGVSVGTDYIVAQIAPGELAQMQANIEYIRILENSGASKVEIQKVETQIDQYVAAQKVEVKGGCAGKNGHESSQTASPDQRNGKAPSDAKPSESERKNWKKSRGRCIVESCPTRPGKVTVGPCGVCMDRCQKIFDRGGDPTKMGGSVKPVENPAPKPHKTEQKVVAEASSTKISREVKIHVSDEKKQIGDNIQQSTGALALAGAQ